MTIEPEPGPPSRSRLILAIVAGVLVLVVVIVAVLVFVLGGDDNGGSTTAGSSSTQSNASSSSTTKSTSSATSTPSSSPTAPTSGSSSSGARVVVDGKEQNISGTVRCIGGFGVQTINIGTEMAILLNDATDPIGVKSVNLRNVEGGALLYESIVGNGDATATKTDNTYKISGHENKGSSNRAFEIEVTCP
jgi:lipoprotein LpqH